MTGPLIIDRARAVGFCGMTDRVTEEGCAAMHDALGLSLTLRFDLAPGEYHTNVVMAILAGRACVLHRDSFADPAVPDVIAELYGGATLELTDAEKVAFAGNCISVTESEVFMSRTGVEALRSEARTFFHEHGFALRGVDVSEFEKAGGSLRCMVTEVF